MRIILNNETFKKNVVKLPYRVVNNLLYFDDNEKSLRLCISSTIKTKVFKFIYNEMSYFNYVYIHERLIKRLYIFKIIIKFYKFIYYCLYYQLNQTSRHKFYDFL